MKYTEGTLLFFQCKKRFHLHQKSCREKSGIRWKIACVPIVFMFMASEITKVWAGRESPENTSCWERYATFSSHMCHCSPVWTWSQAESENHPPWWNPFINLFFSSAGGTEDSKHWWCLGLLYSPHLSYITLLTFLQPVQFSQAKITGEWCPCHEFRTMPKQHPNWFQMWPERFQNPF